MRRAAAVALLVLAGCPGDNEGGHCELRTRKQALTGAERKVVGAASPYPGDPALRARTDELISSQRARREVAWQAAARALAPIQLAQDLPGAGVETVPRWRTWYAEDDLKRVFQKVWRQQPADLRHARAPIPDADLDAAFVWNPTAVEEDAAWPQQRWDDYLASLDTDEEVNGVGGIERVGFDPAAARNFLASYAEEMACLADGAPPAFVDGAPLQPQTAREGFALGACEEQSFGPYFVAGGETLSASAEAALTVVRDAPDGDVVCEAAPGEACIVDGPGAMWVIASSELAPVSGTLEVAFTAPDAPWAGCLAERFEPNAALVKADWRRAELEFQLPVHETTADALAEHTSGDADWGEGEGTADPGPDEIYTVVASSGNRYRLSAMHLMTRELDHWLWVTLWWSPDPDTDFGADRPAAITDLGGPWSHYKMCTSVAFTEEDPDPQGGFAADHPDLAAALAVVSRQGGPSWCSNPYLEVGHGDATTNCVGCHQHGGTKLPAEEILLLEANGRTQLRNNFPVDYSWQSDGGDHLAEMLRDEVEYWDDVP